MASYKTGWVKKKINDVYTKVFAFAHAKTVYTDYQNGTTLDEVLVETEDYDQSASTEAEISPVILSKINAVSEQEAADYNLLNANKAESTDVYTREEVNNIINELYGSINELSNRQPILKKITDKQQSSVTIIFPTGKVPDDPFEVTVIDSVLEEVARFVCLKVTGEQEFRVKKCFGDNYLISVIQYAPSYITIRFNTFMTVGSYVEVRYI